MTTTMSPPRPARADFPLRDRPSVVWLVLAAVVAAAHPWVPGADWLLVHLVLLGAMTHAALVWSAHFSQALLKTAPTASERRVQSRRILLLLVASSLVFVGVPTAWWPLTALGATGVAAAVVWHGVALYQRMRRALPGRFRGTVHYYVSAAACVPVGALLGALLAREPDGSAHGRLIVAHSLVMVLGWLGLTMTGTLVTLWPTMLRTRIDERAERLARQALPGLLVGLLVVAAAAVAGLRAGVVAGLALYAGALAWWARALLGPARRRPPNGFATLSVTAALCWYAAGIAWVGVTVATTPTWSGLENGYDGIATGFAVGFAAQLLTGALSYLLPVVLGGGPSVVRSASAWLDRAAVLRVTTVNAALVLALLPVPGTVRLLCFGLVVAALVVFLALAGGAVRASLLGRAERADEGRQPDAAAEPAQSSETPLPPSSTGPPSAPSGAAGRPWSSIQLIAGLAVVAVAASVAVAVNPPGGGVLSADRQGSGLVAPSGRTTTVRVSAQGMRFAPDAVTVPRGDRLVVELVNDDATTAHDLVLVNGSRSPRLSPGQRAEIDAGVVGAQLDGWCSLVGHRQMGMTFTVRVTGEPAPGDAASAPRQPGTTSGHGGAGAGSSHGGAGSAAASVDLTRQPGADFTAHDPVLPPLAAQTVHRVTFRVQEVELQVAPGVWQRRWTFNGQAPGPTLHGRVGDVFEVTLVNDGSMGHSIDFHAGALAPDQPMRTIPPGQSLLYRFTATRAGVWMYHCSTMPLSAHIAAGMHGAVVIEPPDLPAVDRSYLLVQSEVYLGPDHAAGSASEVDADKVRAERPDAVVFNGTANQYAHRPLAARVGERVRIWVLDAGPNRPSSFHVVGGQFDTVYAEGSWLLRPGPGQTGGSQVLALGPSQGGFVELTLPEAGHYPLVSHVMVDAERGAHGILAVTP